MLNKRNFNYQAQLGNIVCWVPKGMQTVTAFPSRSMTRTTRVLERVHTYVMEFLTLYENQWGARLSCLRSDNGTEFVNKTTAEICQQNEIVHQRSVPYSPKQNGVAERMNRTIMETARSMLHYKSVSTDWWTEAVNTAVYLVNRSSNTAHTDITPYELAFKMKPQIDHSRVFDSHGYAHIDNVKRTELEHKNFKFMFLGYAENVKGYRVFDLENAKVKVTRSVKLYEREVDGICDTQEVKPERTTQAVKDGDEVKVQHQVNRQPVLDDPMEAVEVPVADVEMDDMVHAPGIDVQRLMPSESPVQKRLELMENQQPT
ncbi:FOG: Transposon-encoded proteins with TYA, reverse transcriptase, integrase domains in various combinations [Plasmopara halstedii]|uniref:FOG: Transposon-encoded proteins with TYA, reverse transcriptase, integrase domains in various combinations n=1 Tax=Plasmopara halstedii TaxID=4781 RepID=A0A0P1ACE4_PLAHL|nr:FOG: Transposon-encoded proteins with TYA, reverse transcriptase, integrase domains in various combinations [Plasmopara halstedii]CEG38559.1 FOG: Transposon-encoded proteins with TYA, reverse transcriptase, integrase domains in various combinations [Plasmopara halstedii]|eukprot:XP_024574928.1 FOG: Transposon-encoded proteins with TYA, reverse transcriptase, integrase domains in various combinations [Plasmopara halstedii]